MGRNLNSGWGFDEGFPVGHDWQILATTFHRNLFKWKNTRLGVLAPTKPEEGLALLGAHNDFQISIVRVAEFTKVRDVNCRRDEGGYLVFAITIQGHLSANGYGEFR